MSSIDTPRSHYATVSRVQQCRTPSTNCTSTMSNSIDSQCPVNNVELHRLSELTRPVFSLEIAVELRHGELSSCAIYTLNTCNLLPRSLVLRKSKVFKSNFQFALIQLTGSVAPFHMNHGDIDYSSTSVTNDNHLRVRRLRRRHRSANFTMARPSTVNHQPSTFNIAVELLNCKLQESNSFA